MSKLLEETLPRADVFDVTAEKDGRLKVGEIEWSWHYC